VEADGAGLIELIEELRKPRVVQRERDDGYPYRETIPPSPLQLKAAARLASLSAAKVEAEKEVERLRADLREALDMVREVAQTSNYSDSAFDRLKGRAQGDGE
jgi:hypothetical protein